MSVTTQELGIELLRLKNEVDACYSRLQVFTNQGLGLSMLSSLGQMVLNITHLITDFDTNEFDQQHNPNQLSLDFDGPSPGGDGADAGHPESEAVC